MFSADGAGEAETRAHLNGTKNSRTAFSCTCHPHKKLVIAAKTTESRKRLYVGSNHSLTRKMEVKRKVRRKVVLGVMLGRTPKVVEPIRPREEEVRAVEEMGTPRETRSTSREESVPVGREEKGEG